jgi:hypothetical protein
MKKYIIPAEKHVAKYLTPDELLIIKDIGFIHILCYHVNENLKYPFIQFLMDKTPHDMTNIVREEIILPCIVVGKNTQNVENVALQKLKTKLESIGCNVENVNLDNNFVGIIAIYDSPFLLFNVSNVLVNPMKFCNKSSSLFVLPTEIMNAGSVYNVSVNKHTRNLFLSVPELSILQYNNKHHETYPVPDVVYSYYNTDFECVVGILKKQWVSACAPHYGFCKKHDNNSLALRCVLFAEDFSFYAEENSNLTLTDEEIEKYHKESNMIYIYYEVEKFPGNIDILVFNDTMFEPLSVKTI